MPDNQVHSEHTYRLYGKRASDLHRWMDEPWKSFGRSHRELRHDPNDSPEWAIEKYGLMLTKKMMQDHVELDIQETDEKFGNQDKCGVLEENEKVVHVINAGNTDFIVTDNQLIITQDANVVHSYLLNDISVELEHSRPLFGLLSRFTKKKYLKIHSTYSSTYEQFTINLDELEANQFIMMLKQ